MPRKEILDRTEKYIQPFRITKGQGFQLKNHDPGDTCGLKLDKGGHTNSSDKAPSGSHKSRKLIAAVIALALFPVTIPLLVLLSKAIDGVTLLAGAYNVVGVAVRMPPGCQSCG